MVTSFSCQNNAPIQCPPTENRPRELYGPESGNRSPSNPPDPPSFIGPRLLRPAQNQGVFPGHAPPLTPASEPAATTNERSLRPTHPARPTAQTRKKERKTRSVLMLKAANKPMNSHETRNRQQAAAPPLPRPETSHVATTRPNNETVARQKHRRQERSNRPQKRPTTIAYNAARTPVRATLDKECTHAQRPKGP